MHRGPRRIAGSMGVLAVGILLAGCSAAGAPTVVDEPTSSVAATGSSLSPAEPEGDSGAIVTQWGDRTVALPGAEGDPVSFCDSIDWSPVVAALQTVGITETGRSQGSWSEVPPSYWPSTAYQPVGRVLVGSCDLSLSSASDLAYTLSGVYATIWVLSEGVDAPEFWQAWYYSTQIDTPTVPGLVPGSLESATSSYYQTDNPILFAVADNVMVEVASETSTGNAEARTPADPAAEPLMSAYQLVAGQVISWSQGL